MEINSKDYLIMTALINDLPQEWLAEAPKHLLIYYAAQCVIGVGYAKTTNALRDLADLIENAGMQMEFDKNGR